MTGGGTLSLAAPGPTRARISETSSTVNLGGTFTLASLGGLQPHRRDGQPDRDAEQRRHHAWR